ncbi:MAG: YfhO family protein [Alphaproteobacteria bacterium]
MKSKRPVRRRAQRNLANNKATKAEKQPRLPAIADEEPRFGGNQDRAAVTVLLALALAYFLPVLLRGDHEILSYKLTDIWNQYYFWRKFGFGALARGEIPLWNPFIYSGTPYLAGVQSALFYPLNVLYLFVGTAFATNLSIALHCFLASWFAYLFSRYLGISPPGSTLAAIVYAYGAPYFLHIFPGHLSNLCTMTWLPLLLLAVEAFIRNKRIGYALLGGTALAMQVLAGHPQYTFYSGVAVLVYFVASWALRREFTELPFLAVGMFILFLTAAGLSAVQLLPALELTHYSVRQALSYEWVAIFSFPPENLLTLFFPDFFGDFLSAPYWGKNYLWEASAYLGIIPVVLAFIALCRDRSKTVKTFSVIALVSLLFAFGRYTPLLWILYRFVPGFDLFRGLGKFIFISGLAIAIIGGRGLDVVVQWRRERKNLVEYTAYGLLGAAALVALTGVALLNFQGLWRDGVAAYVEHEPRYSPLPALQEPFFALTNIASARAVFRAAGIAALLSAALLLFHWRQKLSARLMAACLIALTALDLWSFGYRYLVTFDPAELEMDAGLKAFLAKDQTPFRVAVPKLPDVNMGMTNGTENVGGYDALVLKDYSELVNFAVGIPLDEPNLVMAISSISPIFNLLNTKYYIMPSEAAMPPPRLDLQFQDEHYRVYLNDSALPRSFLVQEVRVIQGRDAILKTLVSPAFNPRSTAVVEEPPEKLSIEPAAGSPLPRIVQRSLNRVVIDARPNAAALLVLGDSYYPGWKAYVDGTASKIYRVNYAMRGVFLSQGHHVVEFRYQPASFYIGLAVSAASLLGIAAFVFWSRWSAFNADSAVGKIVERSA